MQHEHVVCHTYLCIDLDVKPHKITLSIASDLVLHAGIAPASTLELIEEVCHNLSQHNPCYSYSPYSD